LAHIFHWYSVPGWSSLTVLVSLLGGATLMSIGIVGEYVGKIYEQSKGRPLYLVASTVNVDHRQTQIAEGPAVAAYDYPVEVRRRL
jgi:dolichol-phosphate mannosyltransferase